MRYVVIFLMLVSFSYVTQAQDESPTENACYAGGVWAGKCDWPGDAERTEWAWACGHYYVRILTGRAALTDVPVWCGFAVEEPTPPAPEPFALCLTVVGDILLQGVPNQPGNVTLYAPASGCSGAVSSGAVIWMQTGGYIDYIDALALCADTAPSVMWTDAYQIFDPTLTGFNFVCYEGAVLP